MMLEKLTVDQLQQLQEVLRPEIRVTWDPQFCIENYFYIKTKQKSLSKLVLNDAQLYYFRNRSNNNAIIKPRQLGFSTFILAYYFWETLTHSFVTSMVVSHDFDSTERLFQIVDRFYQHLPPFLKVNTDRKNRRELKFSEMDSSFFVNTSEKIVSGRGDTINNLHCSEVAFWSNADEVMPALMEAVPLTGNIDLECSPEGRINKYFQEFWEDSKQGKNGFKSFFFPWWFEKNYKMPLEENEELPLLSEDKKLMSDNPEISLEQMKFYLRKRAVLKGDIHREYPSDDVRPFLTSGECFFETEILDALLRNHDFITPQKFQSFNIYKPPIVGRKYVIGGDTAKGTGGGISKCSFQVIDVETCEQVADFEERITPNQFGRIIAKAGRLYNNALIAVESNHPGPATLYVLLDEEKYDHLYYYKDFSKKDSINHHNKERASIEAEGQLGYPTNEKTRPLYLLHLKEMLEEGLLKVNSFNFVMACYRFILDENGRPKGIGDDPIIAMGIAMQIRKEHRTPFNELLSQVKVSARYRDTFETAKISLKDSPYQTTYKNSYSKREEY